MRATWPSPALGTVPWLLALAGIVVPLVGSGFVTWPISIAWLVALVLVWMGRGAVVPTRSQRIVAALLLLPLLVVLGWVGGWWLIPAVLAWAALSVAGRGR